MKDVIPDLARLRLQEVKETWQQVKNSQENLLFHGKFHDHLSKLPSYLSYLS